MTTRKEVNIARVLTRREALFYVNVERTQNKTAFIYNLSSHAHNYTHARTHKYFLIFFFVFNLKLPYNLCIVIGIDIKS